MLNKDQLRNRAARLLALALKAREEGHLDNAERFTQRASEILEHPTALERLGTQVARKPQSTPSRMQTANAAGREARQPKLTVPLRMVLSMEGDLQPP
jgi:hypothetical protein